MVRRNKDTMDVWRFQQIADCCLYFQQHHHNSTTSQSGGRQNVVSFVYDSNDPYWQAERYQSIVDSLKEKGKKNSK